MLSETFDLIKDINDKPDHDSPYSRRVIEVLLKQQDEINRLTKLLTGNRKNDPKLRKGTSEAFYPKNATSPSDPRDESDAGTEYRATEASERAEKDLEQFRRKTNYRHTLGSAVEEYKLDILNIPKAGFNSFSIHKLFKMTEIFLGLFSMRLNRLEELTKVLKEELVEEIKKREGVKKKRAKRT